MKRGARGLGIAALVLWASAAGVEPPAAQCPQPRFTGKAPAEFYDKPSPLAADADTRGAQREYRKGGRHPVACAECHGEKGDGRGPMAEQFDPPPRNFRCRQTVNGIPDGHLFWIIRHGSPGTAMPPHAKFSDAEVWEMVLYLRKLAR